MTPLPELAALSFAEGPPASRALRHRQRNIALKGKERGSAKELKFRERQRGHVFSKRQPDIAGRDDKSR